MKCYLSLLYALLVWCISLGKKKGEGVDPSHRRPCTPLYTGGAGYNGKSNYLYNKAFVFGKAPPPTLAPGPPGAQSPCRYTPGRHGP